MANGGKYHISDDGTPGPCKAQSTDSCPKTKAGDSFHGDLAEATAESARRFEEEHGTVAPAQKAKPAPITGALPYAAVSRVLNGETFSSDTIADRLRSFEKEGVDTSSYDDEGYENPTNDLAFALAHSVSDRDREYLVNEVPLRDMKAFKGEKKALSKDTFTGLIKIHQEQKKRHGRGVGPEGFVQHRIPKHLQQEYISNGDGIGSLRPWGQPSNSIQNMSRETGEMVGHAVIDRYGVERAEEFWSKASARTGNNRATLTQVFKTFRDFDRELKSKG